MKLSEFASPIKTQREGFKRSLKGPVTVVAHDVGTFGGMERQFGELVCGLLARGYHITVIARRCDVSPQRGLTFLKVPGPARPFVLAYVWFFVAASAILARRRAGLVLTMGAIVFNKVDIVTVQFCHQAFRRAHVRRWSGRGWARRVNADVSAWLSRLAERFCYRTNRIRRIAAASQGIARELGSEFPQLRSPISVIPNGVDASVFAPNVEVRNALRKRLGFSNDDFVALFVGGDWERKGLDCVIRALARTARARLLVVGKGDLAVYQRLADDQGLGDRVVFAGPVKSTAKYYAVGDAFVFPTAYEAFPLVILEAAASGLPLISTAVNGVEELIEPGLNGWFVPRDERAIAGKLRQLENDPDLRERMGASSRRSALRYTWEEMADGYSALLSEISQ